MNPPIRVSSETTRLDFYLSEMSVSNLHGGGLTLQRVLGRQLENIQVFAHVSRFATDHPSCELLRNRGLDIPMWLESDAARKTMGCRPAMWLSRRSIAIQTHARGVASRIAERFDPTRPLKGLICPQGIQSLYSIKALVGRRSTEYVTWVMDDHLIKWDGEWRYPKRVEALFAQHLRGARAVFVISPAMRSFFQSRFGVDSRVLFAPADYYGDPVWETPHDGREVRLAYFGTLGMWHRDALELLTRHLQDANAHLDIYNPQHSHTPLHSSRVTFREPISPEQVISAMRRYDAVVLPASYHPGLRNMTEFNIATKMSECLASGTITLVVAPPYAAMARFLDGSGAAVLVQTADRRGVMEAVEMLRDPGHRKGVLKSAAYLVRSRLSIAAMKQVWNEGMTSLV